MAEGEARKMSLSRDRIRGEKPNLIKAHSESRNLMIVDYRNVVEEIEADKMGMLTVDSDAIAEPPDSAADQASASDVSSNPGEPGKDAISEAYQLGFEAGRKDSSDSLQAEFERKISEVTESFDSLVKELATEVTRFNQDFDRAVVTLALAIAKRVVAREIEVDEGAVLARSREAIRKIIGVEKIKIHVSPSDEEYIRGHRNELSTYADSVKEIVIEADGKVERGGCIIESELGNIDARVSTQFELIEESLLGLIE